MLIYYSGEGSKSNPEITLQDKANIMLTYGDMHKKNRPTKRFRVILKARKRKKGKK